MGYRFRKGEYAYIHVDSGEPLEYVIFVHDILYQVADVETKFSHLVVTKYSFLGSAPLFQIHESSRDREVVMSDREVLLHFSDFDKMGERADAEVMQVDDI